MGDDLGVGVAGELGSFGDELLFQLAEVLDDAVMHHRHLLGHVRMRIGLDRLAVGGPAGMADAGVAVERGGFEALLKIAQLAFGAPPPEMAILDGGNAGGVVAAIFEALERIDQLLGDRAFAENANDAAHRPLLPRIFSTS